MKWKQNGGSGSQQLWINTLFLLKNLPSRITEKRLYHWIYDTFAQKAKRLVFVDDKQTNPNVCYLVELHNPTISVLSLSRKCKKGKVTFDVKFHCEKVSSEEFAKKYVQEPESDDVSYAERCLLVRQITKEFPVKGIQIRKIIDACIGENVKKVTKVDSEHSKTTNDVEEVIVEFETKESVQRLLNSYKNKESLLSIPMRMSPLSKGAAAFARINLAKAKEFGGHDVQVIQNGIKIKPPGPKNKFLSKQMVELGKEVKRKDSILEEMKISMQRLSKKVQEKENVSDEQKQKAQALLAKTMIQKTNEMEELKEQLIRKDTLLAESRKAEMDIKSQLEEQIQDNLDIKEECDEHKKKCMEYEKQIFELNEEIEEITRRQKQRSGMNHDDYLQKLRNEYGVKLRKELASVQGKLVKSKLKVGENGTKTEDASAAVEAKVDQKASLALDKSEENKNNQESMKKDAERRRDIEWETVKMMFKDDKIYRSENKKNVFHHLSFPTSNEKDSKAFVVNFQVDIPDGYPTSPDSSLVINCALEPKQDEITPGLRERVENSIPRLLEFCRWESNNLKGHESLLFILLSAETWVQNEWQEVPKEEQMSEPKGSSGDSLSTPD